MSSRRILNIVDSHTAGEPTRIVYGGIPKIPGKTMQEKRRYFRENYDYIRKAAINEPRGHSDMFGGVITDPVRPDSMYGIIFIDTMGYPNMCGHGSIGSIITAVETGLVDVKEPLTEFDFDSPAGLIRAEVHVENRRVSEVVLHNVPSFVYKRDIILNVPGIGEVAVDISYGGNFFAMVDATRLGFVLELSNIRQLMEKGMRIYEASRREIKVEHPLDRNINEIDFLQFYSGLECEENDRVKSTRNIVIFGYSQFDRSPCGTGTSARMALLHSKGELEKGDVLINESIVGTKFKGWIKDYTGVAGYEAIVPEVSGTAFITGLNTLILGEDDPFQHGFNINEMIDYNR